MSLDENDKKKRRIYYLPEEEGDDQGTGSEGSTGSSIQFKEFIGTVPLRDDLLSGDELKRLLTVHANESEAHVRKAKETMAERKALKEGKINLETYRKNQAGRSNASQYESHPALERMSGADPKVSFDPNQNAAETNEDKKKLVLNFDLRHELKQKPAPVFNPRPQPR